LPPDLRPPK
jgi:hypothetical protein